MGAPLRIQRRLGKCLLKGVVVFDVLRIDIDRHVSGSGKLRAAMSEKT